MINALGIDRIRSAKYPQKGGAMIPIIEKTAKITPTCVLLNPSFCSNNVLKAEVVIAVSNKMLTQENATLIFLS